MYMLFSPPSIHLRKAWIALTPSLALVALLIVGLAFSSPAAAQEVSTSRPGVNITFGGEIQPRFSYAWVEDDDERLGYGVRRARLATTINLREELGAYIRFNAAAGGVAGVDAFAFYNTGDFRFRLGRFAGVQPRAHALTGGTQVDAVDRAAIAERWGSRTIGGDGRDFGIEGQWNRANTTYSLFLHGGDGNWSRARGQFRESISSGDVTGGGSQTGMALSLGAQRTSPEVSGLSYGGFVSYNASRNPNTRAGPPGTERAYTSAGGHLYYGATPGSQPLRGKLDLIALNYEEVGNVDESLLGISLLGAAQIHEAAEAFVRYEHEDITTTIDRATQFVTAGVSFSASALDGRPYQQERITLGYMAQIPVDEGEPQQHLLVLQLQLTF